MTSIIPIGRDSVKIPVPLLLLLLVPVITAGCGSSASKDAISEQPPPPPGATLACLACHSPAQLSLDPLFTNGSGTAGKHIAHVTNSGFACGTCHDNYTSQTSHMNGTLDTPDPDIGIVYFDSTNLNGQWNDDTGSCSNIYCHSMGTSTTVLTPNIVPSWTGSLDTTCTGCHSGDSSASNKMETGSHSKHVVSSNYDCSKCHNETVSNSRTINNPANHVNKLVNVKFDAATNLNGTATYNSTLSPVAKTPGTSFGACSNTYCHGDGTSVATGVIRDNASPTWGSTAVPLACTTCHGYPPSYPQMTLTQANPKANEHVYHMANGINLTCRGCHYDTTTDNTTTNPAYHVNGQYNVRVAPGMTYENTPVTFTYIPDPGGLGGRCDNLSCHDSAFWGGFEPFISGITITHGPACYEAQFVVTNMINVEYPVTYTWTFGDGQTENGESNTLPSSSSHKYSDGTQRTVTITGRDSLQRYLSRSTTVTPQPVANISPTGHVGSVDVNRYTVTIKDLSSDPDYNTCGQGPGNIYITWKTGTTSQYSINLTDVASNTFYSSPCVPFGNLGQCTNTYNTAGSYRIRHKVVDNVGGSSVETYADVTLPGSTSISGKVFKSDGTGLAGAAVYLKKEWYYLDSNYIAKTTTGEDGSYSFSGTYNDQYLFINPTMAGYSFPFVGQYVYINRDDVNFTALQ